MTWIEASTCCALVKESVAITNSLFLYVILDLTKFCRFILIGHRNGDFVSTLEVFLYVLGEVVAFSWI